MLPFHTVLWAVFLCLWVCETSLQPALTQYLSVLQIVCYCASLAGHRDVHRVSSGFQMVGPVLFYCLLPVSLLCGSDGAVFWKLGVMLSILCAQSIVTIQ